MSKTHQRKLIETLKAIGVEFTVNDNFVTLTGVQVLDDKGKDAHVLFNFDPDGTLGLVSVALHEADAA